MRLLVLASFLLACTEPRSKACKQVCKREAECIEEATTKVPFDEKECVAACAALEQDTAHSNAKVQRHIECVNSAKSCLTALECK